MTYVQKLHYRGMDLMVVLVTPEIAHAYLAKNVGNRKLQKSAIANYAADMQSGNWEDKPLAICFDEAGQLGNGQHTLHAIIASGKPQYLLIAENVRRRSIAMMDIGQKRTINDIAHFVGEDFNGPRAAVVRIMLSKAVSGRHAGFTFSRLLEAYQFYQEAIDFAFSIGGKSKCKGINAVTQSVAAMAWYTKDRDRIAEFMEALRTGCIKSADDDMAVIRLREVMLKPANAGGLLVRQDQFRKTVSALDHFLNRKGAMKLYGRDPDIFPYPQMED